MLLNSANNPVRYSVNDKPGFQSINRGYNSVFRPNHMSLGLVVPLETYSQGPTPTMTRHLERVQLAEQLGFSAIWLRDVPFNLRLSGPVGGSNETDCIGCRQYRAAAAPSGACRQSRRERGRAVGWATNSGRGLGRPTR